jgi:hypothetical protein
MAKCNTGYICQVCHEEVKGLTQSDLYLRYVIGRVDPETLHLQPERHIRCNPSLAQFIEDENFESLKIDPDFSKANMDADYVSQQTKLVTRGFERLKEISKSSLSVLEYPLKEFRRQDGEESI